ncbi:hypothetical protein K1719_036673 [Acacia pycnantha]|nr:hypothetical protein K1719_036673 [Acacia pycnantha]
MASVAATQVLLHNVLSRNHRSTRFSSLQSSTSRSLLLRIRASQTSEEPRERQKVPPGVDTRIHWDNEDEGWIGGTTSNSKQSKPEDVLGQNFADLLSDFSGSHYEFLGVSAEADLEEIKAAYRRLSKEYHPDTTSLPLKTASDKFMKLREVYNVLSNGESRKFYDWTLLQEAASRQSEKMKMRLEDPQELDVKNRESVPDMVDRLGGRNMKLKPYY